MNEQKPYLRGLPLHLADGKEYYFPSIRLGTLGDPVRKKIRDYSNLMLDIVDFARSISERENQDTLSRSIENIKEFNLRSDELEDKKNGAFIDLCATSLEENYGQEKAMEISSTLITPENVHVILELIRSGRYPENFTRPPSSH